MNIKRNILLNPGPSTTTDTVKMAQVVPDICPREDEFAEMMRQMRKDLVKIVHGDPQKYTSVLFCGSGTLNLDVCVNSLLPEGKKILVVNNGAYSSRAVEICEYYGLDHINLQFPIDEQPDLKVVEKTMKENPDIAVVYTTHNETGTGVGNPIREIGAIAHAHDAIFIVDTTSTYAMVPIDIEKDNIDFCMASAQKGLMSMTGLSFVVGNEAQELDEDEYYIADLLGMKVLLEDGSEFGTLKNVMETGANDVYIVDSVEHGEVLLPAIKECILDVDIETNTMTVHLMKGLL